MPWVRWWEVKTLRFTETVQPPWLCVYFLVLSCKGTLLIIQQGKQILSAFVTRQRKTRLPGVLVVYTDKQLGWFKWLNQQWHDPEDEQMWQRHVFWEFTSHTVHIQLFLENISWNFWEGGHFMISEYLRFGLNIQKALCRLFLLMSCSEFRLWRYLAWVLGCLMAPPWMNRRSTLWAWVGRFGVPAFCACRAQRWRKATCRSSLWDLPSWAGTEGN